jgi:hypothetical protein
MICFAYQGKIPHEEMFLWFFLVEGRAKAS